MSRPLSELRIRATAHEHDGNPISMWIGDDFLSDVADGKISPSTAFKLAYARMKCLACAKAVRWLAVIARDYGAEEAHEVRGLM